MKAARQRLEAGIEPHCHPKVEDKWKDVCDIYEKGVVKDLDFVTRWVKDRTDEDIEIQRFFRSTEI